MRFTALVPAGVLLAGLACGDGFTEPSTRVTLRVSVTTQGIDQDVNGYHVYVSGSAAPVDTIGTVSFSLPPGTYEVRLDDLAPNCAPDGPGTVSAQVASYTTSPRDITRVTFRVVCYAATATIEVFAASTSRDFPRSGVIARVSGPSAAPVVAVFANVASGIPVVSAGTYTVTLEGLPDHCALEGSNSHTVTVATGGLTRDIQRVGFTVVCQPITGDIHLVVRTGSNPDSDGYLVELDGAPVLVPGYYGWYYYDVPLRLAASASHLLERVASGDHTIGLTDIAAHCAVNGTNPRSIAVPLGAIVEVTFDIVCT